MHEEPKKGAAETRGPFVCAMAELLALDRAGRARALAGPAVDAEVRVYNVLGVAFGNRFNRAGLFACAALDAFVANDMCHFLESFR